MNKDTKNKTYRINFFDQEKRFHEIAKNSPEITLPERGLYFYLLNLNNRLSWTEWFSLPISQALTDTKVSEKSYYKILHVLESNGLIEHRKGVKNRAGLIKINVLKAVNFTPLTDSKAVNFTENGLVYIDSKDKRDVEDAATPGIKIETVKELREIFSNEDLITDIIEKKKVNREEFVSFKNRWVDNKSCDGNFHYSKQNLIKYFLIDWDKQASGKVEPNEPIIYNPKYLN